MTRLRVQGLVALLAVAAAACGGRQRPTTEVGGRGEPSDPGGAGGGRAGVGLAQPDPVRLYRQMGLLAGGGQLPFVGRVAFFASRSADSTYVLFAVSMPTQALTFGRDGDRYQARYGVEIALRQNDRVVRRVDAHESVRVLTFRETTRGDESVIFQQMIAVAPGQYDLALAVRDDASQRSNSIEAVATVPRLVPTGLSTPLPVYEGRGRGALDSLPHLVPTPRSTVALGQDSVISVYVEGYGGAAGASSLPVTIAIRGEGGTADIWRDSATLARRAGLFGGVVTVPVARVGIGPATLLVARRDTPDTMRAPVFVTFGEDLPVASFAEMVSYLRYFTSSQRLQGLRDSRPEERAAAWSAFVKETDPDPTTPTHEGLRDYFGRIAQANLRFREEGGAGWLTDRGRVFVALGAPDNVYEPTQMNMNQRGRRQYWQYQRFRGTLEFYDQTGFGRWRLTVPSESEFESIVRRELGAAGR